MNSAGLPLQVRDLVRRFFELLAAGDYRGIAAEPQFTGLSSEDIRSTLDEYPGRGVPGLPTVPPSEEIEAPAFSTELEQSVAEYGGWAIDVTMYFDGIRSDFTLQCNVYCNETGRYSLEVIDLHEL